ncbi:LysR family transcriptional regulator [Actinomadura sp. NTSP31]|uniref:LysR family transcriptional regulator n=1 Tax=Actinomadura sp. NTSP31 TaxID=1735447 RepID=UPI0035C04450
MELRDIEIFLTLAEELHFGRTAERLCVSPARVTQAIKKQERRLGVPLFERTSRSVRLTAAGQQLYRELSAGYRQIMDGIEAVSATARGISGTLRVGSMGGANAWKIDPIVMLFQARHPAVRLLHRDINTVDPLALLRSGEIDVGTLWLPLREPDLTVGPVTHTSSQVLIVSAGHPYAARESVCREDFGDLTFPAHASPIPAYMEEFFQPFRTPAGRPIARGPLVTNWDDLLKTVGAGQAVAAGVAEAAAFYPWPNLVYLPILDAPPVSWVLAWRTAAENDLIRSFVQAARDAEHGTA